METNKELDLVKKAFVKAKKDKQARNLLIESNKKLIYLVINRYFSGYREFEKDLFGYGVFGLIKAIESFNPQKGKFSNHAVCWVRHAISREMKQFGPLILLPENVVAEGKRLKIFLRERGEDEEKDAHCYVGVSVKKVKLLKETLSFHVTSFSTPVSVGDVGGRTVEDFISAPNRSIEKITHFNLLRRRLEEKLPPVDYKILSRMFGLDGKGQRTLEETGHEIEMKKKTVFMAYGRAMERAKKIMKCAGIHSAHF